MNARKTSALSILPILLAAGALVACGSDGSSVDVSGSAAPAPSQNAGTDDGSNANGSGSSVANAERTIAEADVVQLVDGRLYAMSKSGTLSIVDVSKPGRLAILGQAYLPGEPFEMYLRGDLLVAMTNGAYAPSGQLSEPAPSSARTGSGQQSGVPTPSSAPPAAPRDPNAGAGVIVLNVKDPGLMQRVATFHVPGEIADSRVVGDILYLATYENSYCYGCGTSPRTMVTTFDISTPSAMRQVDQVTFDAGVRSGWGPTDWKRSIFVTTERMYLGGHDDITPSADANAVPGEGIIDVIDITDPGGKLRKGAHLTTTGAIRSRWQMDEHGGVFRVVSQRGIGYTTNGLGNPDVQTFHVWNADAMQQMGKTSIRLPRQEALKSVRFDGDRAYAITFAQTDPLFVIDLSNEAKPAQRGELLMPGWVFHLDPHGDRVLGLGLDRNDPKGHLNVSLFDVADMDHPKMLGRVSFGSRSYANDQAIVSYEMPEDQDRIQKAFRVLDGNLIAVPYSGAQTQTNSAAYDCVAQGGGVQLIDWQKDVLTKQATLPVAGNPRRALVHDGELLAVSDSNVTAFDLGRRDVPLKTADLVIGSCEARALPANNGVPVHPGMREGMTGEDTELGGYGFGCSTSPSASGRGVFWSGVLLGLAAIGGAVRRRRPSGGRGARGAGGARGARAARAARAASCRLSPSLPVFCRLGAKTAWTEVDSTPRKCPSSSSPCRV